MRALETEIRKSKDEINALQAFGNSVPQIQDLQERIKAFHAKYDRIAEVTGIDKEPKRMAVQKPIIESGVASSSNKKPITPITDTAINSVKKISIDGFTDVQNDYIHSQHKELLKYARDNNGSNEVAFVYRKDLTDRTIFKGSEDVIDFGNGLNGKGDGLFIMHNHPRNSSFSDRDIMFMLKDDTVKTLTIVKNNGGVEILTKTNAYNYETAKMYFMRAYKRFVTTETNEAQIDKAVQYFLNHNGGNAKWIK